MSTNSYTIGKAAGRGSPGAQAPPLTRHHGVRSTGHPSAGGYHVRKSRYNNQSPFLGVSVVLRNRDDLTGDGVRCRIETMKSLDDRIREEEAKLARLKGRQARAEVKWAKEVERAKDEAEWEARIERILARIARGDVL